MTVFFYYQVNPGKNLNSTLGKMGVIVVKTKLYREHGRKL